MRSSINELDQFLKDSANRNFFLVSLISFFIYCLTAYFSSGYHQADEHYQIVQFANFKRGLIPSSELPWEFAAKIRSGLQPFICYVIFISLQAIGIDNPFIVTIILRIVTAFLSIFAISRLIVASQIQLKVRFNVFWFTMCYLIWFLPYVNVRFSSESWSGIFFILAYSMAIRLKKAKPSRYIAIGISLGISVLCRYQCAFLMLGLLSWLYFIEKKKWETLATIISSTLIVLILGIFCDRWLYGVYTLSMYNYFNANIVMDIASKFGTSPWYMIIEYIFYSPWWPIGATLVTSYIFLAFRLPKSPIIWCTLPFLVIHMLIPHKELRFLFPVANFCPLLVISAYYRLPKKIKSALLFRYLSVLVLITDLTLLSVFSSRSTRKGETKIAQYIYTHYKDKKVNLLTSFETDPYDPFMEYSHNFYREPNVEVTRITSIWQPDFITKLQNGSVNLLILPNSEIIGNKTTEKLKKLHAIPLTSQQNRFLYFFARFYDSSLEQDDLNLFHIKP
ncbi:hypothetical protein ACUN24_20470 [Pedobacter sp. WC2501]|uniref:hypothetical protein n=1 Tax=Pedobacter sp. WC2501 TaxID=3461400 RepID=UPI00404578AB